MGEGIQAPPAGLHTCAMTLMFRPLAVLRHRRFRMDLDAFVDGELTATKHHAVAAHIDDCPGCSTVTRQLMRMKRSLRQRRTEIPAGELTTMRAFAEQLTTS